MSFVEQYLLPMFQVMIYIIFFGLACYGFYKFARKILPKELNAWFKYKILKKDYPEETVEWCLDAYEQNADPVAVERYLRLDETSDGEVDETLYIFKKIIQLKGGLKSDGRQIKRSSLKTFSKGESKD